MRRARSRFPFGVLLVLALLLAGALVQYPGVGGRAPGSAHASTLRLPLYFEENRGQADPQVRFQARGAGYGVFLTDSGLVLSLERGAARPPARPSLGRPAPGGPRAAVRMTLEGANPRPTFTGLEPLPGKVHYLRGRDPSRWRRDVPAFARVRSEAVYPGVDAVYYGSARRLEYDFILRPGADPGRIRLRFQGAARLELDARGDLVLHTAAGSVRQHRPVVYQERTGERRTVPGEYRMLGPETVGFAVGAYDRSRPLVIDPVLAYATVLGGSGLDGINAVAVGADGTVYAAGRTRSANFPSTDGAFDRALGAPQDAFVARLNPGGSAFEYVTFLGGIGEDAGEGIAVDADGNAFITGSTASVDFPATGGALDTTHNGGLDAFLTRLDPTGAAVSYSTFLGGSADDGAFDLTLDSAGGTVLAGATASADFPTSATALDRTHNGALDAFVTRLAPSGATLVFSTYLGGAGDDLAAAVAVNGVNQPFVTGASSSANFPIAGTAFDGTHNGGGFDAFAARLAAAGGSLVYSTFLGGLAEDVAVNVAVDSSNRAWIVGRTKSADFPVTSPTLDGALSGPEDAFIVRLAANASSLQFATFLGGSLDDQATAIGLDGAETPHVVGATGSPDFPTVAGPGAPDTTHAGSFDGFAVKLDVAARVLRYSTLLGSTGNDFPNDMSVDAEGRAYLGGNTLSTAFPTTPGAADTTHNGGVDGFIARIDPSIPPPSTILRSLVVSASSIELIWNNVSNLEEQFQVERRSGTGGFVSVILLGPDTKTFTDTGLAPGVHTYRIRAINFEGTAVSEEVAVELGPPAAPSGVTARANTTVVLLQWQDNSSNETAFQVQRRVQGTHAFTTLGETRFPSFLDESASPNTAYVYRVRAFNGAGNSAFAGSNAVAVLAPPLNLSARGGVSANRITLSWVDGSTGETGFEIHRAPGTSTQFTLHRTVGANVTGFSDGTLPVASVFTYKVRAITPNSQSAFSNTDTAVTLPIPAAPTDLRAEALGDDRVRLTWTDNSVHEFGFRIERRLGEGAFREVGRADKEGASFHDSGLKARTRYTWRVFAFNDGGDSPPSNEVSRRTPHPTRGRLGAPSVVTFGAVAVDGRRGRGLALRNLSETESLRIVIGTVDGPFRVAEGGGKVLLPPGGRHRVKVVFRPKRRGTVVGRLHLESTDPSRRKASVALHGTGARR